MTTAIKRRRGTTAEHSTFIGLEGEITIDSTKDTVVVHDGATAGGFPLAKENMTGNLTFTDNAKAIFGAGSDLQIYHDGVQSKIEDVGTGALSLRTNGTEIFFYDSTNAQFMSRFVVGGAVNLYHNGSAKLATTSTGIDVTGLTDTDTLNVSGNTTLGDASTDTVTVNGYIGVGGAGSAGSGVIVGSSALTGTTQIGVNSSVVGSSAATTWIRGVSADPSTAAASFTVANMTSVYAANGGKGAGSTITNKHGLFISDQTLGTNNYGVTSQVSSGTDKWNIYASGTAANYFAGDLRVGNQSAAGSAKVTIQQSADNSTGGYAVYSADGSGAAVMSRLNDGSMVFRNLAQDRLSFTSSGAIFNEGGLDYDFRIESDTNSHAFFLEGSSGNLGLGVTPSGSYKLEVADGDASIYGITIGRGAGAVSTNTAVGASALAANTTGTNNTSIGYLALSSNDTTGSNTAVGQYALRYNIANGNTAVGSTAGQNSTTGVFNTFVGTAAGSQQTTAEKNTLVGHLAGGNITTGGYNVAIGQSAGYTTVYNPSYPPYLFKTGIITAQGSVIVGQEAGRYADGINTIVGYQSHSKNGVENATLGYQTLGYFYTPPYGFVGINSYNVAVGHQALNVANGVIYSTAVGYKALYSASTGDYNTSVGASSLYTNTTGSYNTATGINSLYSNTTGVYNAAFGYQALLNNTTAGYNSAFGNQSLYFNTTGSYNVAVGYRALYNSTGSSNTALGSQLTTGGIYSPAFDCTNVSNRVSIAHTGVTNAYIQVAWTVVSDERDKTNFAPVPHGLSFVTQLKPVAYQFRVDRDSEETNGGVRYGFKAQDILALEGENPVIIDNEDEDKLRYNGESLVPVLVNAIKELKAELDAVKAELILLKGN